MLTTGYHFKSPDGADKSAQGPSEKMGQENVEGPSIGQTPEERARAIASSLEYNAAVRDPLPLGKKLTVIADLTAATLWFLVQGAFLSVKALFQLFTPYAPKDLTGKLALVTGGANGLGRELCLELAARGARVAVVDVNERGARETAKQICHSSSCEQQARAYVANIADPAKIQQLHQEILKDWGTEVEILVNNAGLLSPFSLLNGEIEDYNVLIDVNFKSHFWMLRTFLPPMKKARRGHIVTICSMAGVMVQSGACCYTATKFGIRGLSLCLRAELIDEGLDDVGVTIAYPYYLTTRKELIDFVDVRMPPLSPETAARDIVAAIRRNQLEVSVPSTFLSACNFVSMFPQEVIEFFRTTFRSKIKP